jgi:glucose/arabinose dehydrogenase
MIRRSGRVLAVVAAASTLAACGGFTPPATTAIHGSKGSFDASSVDVALEPIVEIPGGPLGAVDAADGSGRLFVVAQDGRIWIVKNGVRAAEPFLDISDGISSGAERGLLGLAFHPDYPSDPHFYVDYTDQHGDTVVSSWTASSNPDTADGGSEQILLKVDQPFANHNGGSLQFGPDGFLYVSLGDGGSGGDPQGNGQRLNTELAKILRVDVDHPSGGNRYGIPPDNPFVGRDGARPEIWLTGLRNPWRMSFDRASGDLWIGDVGQGAYEEIDVVRAGSGGGQNFGWNTTEGFHCFRSSGCDQDGLTPPVTEYTHDGRNCAVTGGYVYRGAEYPELRGGYVFADYCSGRVWAIDSGQDEVREPRVVLESGRAMSSFGEDEDGELYVTDLSGMLLHLTASPR